MSKVITLRPNSNVPEGLRNIAAAIERGEHPAGTACTIIMGDEVFHLGSVNDNVAVTSAVFDMAVGLAILTAPIVRNRFGD